jgi:hypothetical protein
MSSQDAAAFLNSIDTWHVVGLRDRAFIGVMVFAFAHVSAVAGLKVEDYFPLKNAGGCACGTRAARSMRWAAITSSIEQFRGAYIATAGIAEDKKGPLFRAAIGSTGKLSTGPCRASMRGTWSSDARKTKARNRHRQSLLPRHPHHRLSRKRHDIILPSGWPGIPASRPRSFTTGGAMR